MIRKGGRNSSGISARIVIEGGFDSASSAVFLTIGLPHFDGFDQAYASIALDLKDFVPAITRSIQKNAVRNSHRLT